MALKYFMQQEKCVFLFYTSEIILFSWSCLSDDDNNRISKISFHTTKPPNKSNHRNQEHYIFHRTLTMIANPDLPQRHIHGIY